MDVFLNSFYEINFINFLPKKLNFVFPLIIGFIGLYFIRIEKSGYDFLDSLNKNINTNNFNAILSLLIIPAAAYLLFKLEDKFTKGSKIKINNIDGNEIKNEKITTSTKKIKVDVEKSKVSKKSKKAIHAIENSYRTNSLR